MTASPATDDRLGQRRARGVRGPAAGRSGGSGRPRPKPPWRRCERAAVPVAWPSRGGRRRASGRRGRPPAGGAQPQRQVEVLAVGGNALVEAADRLPGACAGRRRRCRPGRPGPGRGDVASRDRAPWSRGNALSVASVVSPIESISRRPGARTARRRSRAAGRLRAARRAARGSPGRQSTSLLSSTIDVAVAQRRRAGVAGLREAAVVLGAQHVRRPASRAPTARRVPSVEPLSHDDHAGARASARARCSQAALGEVVAVVHQDDDVDRQGAWRGDGRGPLQVLAP